MFRLKKSNVKKSTHRFRLKRKRHEYGQSWMLAAALLEGPRTIEQLEEYYRIMGRRFGVFIDLIDRGTRRHQTEGEKQPVTGMRLNLERTLELIVKRGWAVETDGAYHITNEGRREARRMLKDLEKSGRILEKGTRPEMVSKVTLIVHFVLAAIKFPAALLSGSVGLLNDSLDTFMDGISSLFVFFGVRSGRERLVSFILLSFMTVTGLYTLYKALIRFIRPEPLSTDWTAFTAVAASAFLCALLWVYQKYAGLKHRCVPLIAQSIDSRNHIIVAGGVAAGLVAAFFRFTLLDQIVGLAVAVLILKAAVELFVDLLRSRGDEEIDLSKYGFSRIEKHRHRQMVRWFLFEIKKGRITTREEMVRKARVATDFSKVSSLRAMGLDKQPDQEKKLEEAIREVFEKGLAVEIELREGDEPAKQETVLQLTDSGEVELNRALSNAWSFSPAGHPSGPRSGPLTLLAFALRFVFSAGLFMAIYALGRRMIELLPPMDVWDTGVILGSVFGIKELAGAAHAGEGTWLVSFLAALNTFFLTRTYETGHFSLNGAQALCALIGLLFLYRGRMLIHGGRHSIHHAREHDLDRPYYLVTDGPFSFRRHPMYAGFILINMGIGIGLHSVYTLAWAAVATIIQFISASLEERKLFKWFGREFEEYAARVKQRFLPGWVWILIAVFYCAAWMGL
jgi:divalent metal cation (Fe/Co/Zn/Cd) transporter/protein-S-isoprenylcysteine O-methyltransferase Ste14